MGDLPPRTKLTFILDKPFTLTSIKDAKRFNDKPNDPVITLTTEEEFECVNKEGKELGAFSCFYATGWKAIMDQLKDPVLRADISEGVKIPKMKIVKVTPAKGPWYYLLVPEHSEQEVE